MARVLILCPTFDHQDTLYPTLESVRRQTFQDFEAVVIGDGAPPRTAEIMREVAGQDPRFKYEWYPKHSRMGEPHRDVLIRNSDCEIVAYIADDDLWLPQHLQALVDCLANVDFAHSMHHMVHLDNHVQAIPFVLAAPALRSLAVARETWCFGLSFAAHRRSAYLRLDEGWATTPAGIPTDLNMWAKFAERSDLSHQALLYPTALHLHAGLRAGMAPHARAADAWQRLDETGQAGFVDKLLQRVSYSRHFSYLYHATTPTHIEQIDGVLDYHGVTVQRVTQAVPFPASPKPGVLYCCPLALEQLDIQWRAHAGKVTDLDTRARYQHLVARKPDNHDLRSALAELWLADRQPHAALALTQTFDMEKTARKYTVVHVKAQLACGHFNNALELLDTLLEREPNDAFLHHHRGRALTGMDQRTEALTALRTALSIRPEMPWTHLLMARLLLNQHAPDAAARHVHEASVHGAPASACEPILALIAKAANARRSVSE